MYDIYVCMFMYVSAGTHVKVRITLVFVLAFYLAWNMVSFCSLLYILQTHTTTGGFTQTLGIPTQVLILASNLIH